MTFDLISPLSLKECVRRLHAATDRGWDVAGEKPVLGFVGETSIRLRRRIWARNSPQCWLSATLTEDDSGTRLACSIGMHPYLRRFLEVWIGLVLVFGGTVLIKTIRLAFSDPDPLPPDWWLGVALPLVLLGFAGVLLWLGDYWAQDEPAFLVDFVERTIQAHYDNGVG